MSETDPGTTDSTTPLAQALAGIASLQSTGATHVVVEVSGVRVEARFAPDGAPDGVAHDPLPARQRRELDQLRGFRDRMRELPGFREDLA